MATRDPNTGAKRSAEEKLEGRTRQVKGKATELAGKVTGDKTTQVRGKGEQIAGKAQETWGKVKKGAEDATRAVERERRKVD